MKKRYFFHRYQCDLVTGINGNTFSDQAMLFGAFLMKNISIIFPTHILNCIFCSISVKISCFFKLSWQLCTTTSDQTNEKYWIFWWNYAKNTVQNMGWKNDENIFHQKCTKQHCLVTESVSILCLWRDHIDACEKIKFFHVCRLL